MVHLRMQQPSIYHSAHFGAHSLALPEVQPPLRHDVIARKF
jgi:hypothetical protein